MVSSELLNFHHEPDKKSLGVELDMRVGNFISAMNKKFEDKINLKFIILDFWVKVPFLK